MTAFGRPSDTRSRLMGKRTLLVTFDLDRNAAKKSNMFDLETFVPYRITVLASHIAVTFARQHAEKFGLSIPEWRVVAVLGRYQELSSGEVMERTNMDKAKVSRCISRLVPLGVVARSDNVDDMRSNRLRLTRAGKKMHDQITAIAVELEREMLDVLTEREREVFMRALAKLDQKVIEMNQGEPHGNPHL